MSTIDERTYTQTFAGLRSTAITSGVLLIVGFCGHELFMRIRRYPEEDKRRANGESVPDRGMEGYALGYIYRARSYVPFNPTPMQSSRIFGWIWTTSYKYTEKFYETHCGPDATVYLRILRGIFYWTMLLVVTVFPVLLGINFTFSDPTVSKDSLSRAALDSLRPSEKGRGLLWVHVVAMWFMTFTWYGALGWVGYGAIRIRRNKLRAIIQADAKRLANANEEEKGPEADDLMEQRPVNPQDERPVGWRWRTVLIRNIPPDMRTESAIYEYFESRLRGGSASDSPNSTTHSTPNLGSKPFAEKSVTLSKSRDGNQSPSTPPRLISEIIIVRKHAELNELFNKYRAVQNDLESTHIVLVERVMAFVQHQVDEEARRARGEPEKEKPLWKKLRPSLKMFKTKAEVQSEEAKRLEREGDEKLVAALRCYLPGGSPPLDSNNQPKSIWETFHELHATTPTIFDRFQPLIKLKKFRRQAIPAIDYHLSKLNLLGTLIEDKRANPEQFEAASSAFVTFERAADARRARKDLKWRRGIKVIHGRVLENKVKLAPEVRDLDYNRLVYVSLSSDLLRGAILQTLIWVLTLIWVIPLSFIVGLLSLESITRYLPGLARLLESNPVTLTLFNSLLPTSIVALIGMFVPTLIGIVTRNGQALITVTTLHAAVQSRYWKWLMVNIVIVFCVGITAFQAVLDALKTPESLLPVITNAFPKGASFFVSWTLLTVGLHHGIEILGGIIVAWNHRFIRKLKAPRKREFEAQPRSLNYAYWLPTHLLVLAVTMIFATLNPLVIAFDAFYQIFSLLTFKNQLAHNYWRRWYENNGRLLFRRFFRYSLDSFLVGQAVLLAYFFVSRLSKLGSSIIPLLPITVIVKILGTRWFDALMDEIDEAEIDLVCGESEFITSDMSVPLTVTDESMHHLSPLEMASTVKSFTFRTLPALILRPKLALPAIPSPHQNSKHFHPRAIPSKSKPRSRTTSNRPHVPQSPSLDDDRPMLGPVKSRDSAGSAYELSPMGTRKPKRAHQTFDLQAFAKGEDPISRSSGSSPHIHSQPIVTTHAPIVRDDRPVTNVRYNNPAEVADLARSLWLPRDPLVPVDLGDTIDYHGRAMVSSEGGSGVIGSWDEHLTKLDEDFQAEAGDGSPAPDDVFSAASSLGRATRRISLSLKPIPAVNQPSGNERIRVAGDVASNIEAQEGIRVVESPRPKQRSGSHSSTTSRPGIGRRGTGHSGASSVPGSPPTPRAPGTAPSESIGSILPIDSSTQGSSFTAEPANIPLPSSHLSLPGSPDSPFPPTPISADRRSSLRSRRSYSEDLDVAAGATTITIPPTQPNDTGPASPALSRRGRGRSSSAAISVHASIAEGDEGAPVQTISQSQAIIAELMEEQRVEQEKRAAKEQARQQKEDGDKRGGFMSRFLLANLKEDEEET